MVALTISDTLDADGAEPQQSTAVWSGGTLPCTIAVEACNVSLLNMPATQWEGWGSLDYLHTNLRPQGSYGVVVQPGGNQAIAQHQGL